MTDTVVAEKITKNEAVRKAIEELGIDGDPNLILARAQEIGKCVFSSKQPIYQMKTEMRKEAKGEPAKPAKRPAKVEKISKVVKAPRAKATMTIATPANDVVSSIHAVRQCVQTVGSKELVMEILNALS
jgi:hypothetical protein